MEFMDEGRGRTSKSACQTTISSILASKTAELFAIVEDEECDAISPSERETRVVLAHELESYKSLKRINTDSGNPFKWWEQHMKMFPHISKLAARYLSSPPSSVESERTFSIGGNIVTKDRTRLTCDNTEQMIFLNSNLPNLPAQDYSNYF